MTDLRARLLVLALAVTCDRIMGEWPNAVHPVAWMGRLAAVLERLAPSSGPARQVVAGAFIAVIVPAIFGGLAGALLHAVSLPYAVELVLGVVLLKSAFAWRALTRAAGVVENALSSGALDEARRGLGSLCSRRADTLGEAELAAATIESVAENASDSVVAPLLFYALFGVEGALAYRAVNTLDAMIGYHGRYEYLGKAAARLDDALNFVPARMTALLLLGAGFVSGYPSARALKTWWRDAHTTESPNAGRPMAVMAGLLGVALEKNGHYRLGDAVSPLLPKSIDRACRLLDVTAVLALVLVSAFLGWRGHRVG